jgi:hypothetical protein
MFMRQRYVGLTQDQCCPHATALDAANAKRRLPNQAVLASLFAGVIGDRWSNCNFRESVKHVSSVLHPLPTPLLQLGLPLTLTSRSNRSTLTLGRTSTHTCQSLPRTRESCKSQVSRVNRYRNPSIPRLVPNQCSKYHTEPSPVSDVPHQFRQALGFQILAGALQVAIGVCRPADPFEPEFDEEGWEVENEPGENAA